ncbi:MAG: hypothetical protein KL839_02465 [Rhizobium sp.]|nr:hypothetical protein [Rhizobium sp.]
MDLNEKSRFQDTGEAACRNGISGNAHSSKTKSPDCRIFAQCIRDIDEKSAISWRFAWSISIKNANRERKRAKPTFSASPERAYGLLP